MLKKIVIINSAIYAKATIDFADIATMQLVGENNMGKSSLINTLNFLYIIDQQDMRFEGGRRLKDSMTHYFPDIEQSYILFEIKAENDFCILVKRTRDNEIKYYKIPRTYDENMFFAQTLEGREVVPFGTLVKKSEREDVEIVPLSKEELYWSIYSTKESSEGVVRLTSNAGKKGKSCSNHFTKIYRHLIKSSHITEKDFVEALLRASHTEDKKLTVFSDLYSDSLAQLTKKERELAQLREIEPDFVKVKALFNSVEDRRRIVGKGCYTFANIYPTLVTEKKKAIEKVVEEIGVLVAKKKKVTKNKESQLCGWGALGQQLEGQRFELVRVGKELDAINLYDDPLQMAMIKEEIEVLERRRLHIKNLLARVTSKNNRSALTGYIARLERACSSLKEQITHYDQRLIQHISTDKKIQQKLSGILAPSILYGSKELIQKKVSKMDNILHLFDGAIDVKGVEGDGEIVSLEELKRELKEREETLLLALEVATNTVALEKVEGLLMKKRELWERVQKKEELVQRRQMVEEKVVLVKKKLEEQNKEIEVVEHKLKEMEGMIERLEAEKNSLEMVLVKWEGWRQEVRKLGHIAVVEKLLEERDLGVLHVAILRNREKLEEEKKVLKPLADQLRQSLKRYVSDTGVLIEEIQKDLDNMETIEESCQELLEGVINHYVGPTRQFLDMYRKFKDWVRKFSERLTDYHISGIEKVEVDLMDMTSLVEDLERITSIKEGGELDFEGNQSECKELLQRYIQEGRAFSLQHLFKLSFKITKRDGYSTVLRIDRQMESYGTDKVLRLFIFLHILKELVVLSADKKIVIYVDEIGTVGAQNIQKIVQFCKKHHVLPIFAATELVEGFDRYYPLVASAENNGKVYVDRAYAIEAQYVR